MGWGASVRFCVSLARGPLGSIKLLALYPRGIPLRQDQIVVRRPLVARLAHRPKSRSAEGRARFRRKFDRVRILPHREFFHFFFPTLMRTHTFSRVTRTAHRTRMRHSYFSDLANLRQMDATWPASRRLASVTTALAAPLLVIRSYVITRYRRAHVVPFAR